MSIITADALRARLGEPRLRILDVRWWLTDKAKGRLGYETAHIPGAVWVDLDKDLMAPRGPGRHPLPDARTFAARMAALGVADDSDVVVVDDANGTIAARLWWMLDNLGHGSVVVLNGGMAAWEAIGGPVTTDEPQAPEAPADLHLRETWTGVVDRDTIAGMLGTVVLLDARAHERYRGDLEPVDAKPGHIPTARNRPAAANLRPDGTLLGPEELRAGLAALGAGTGDSVTVTSCGSGVTACHNALAMRVAGLPDPLLYEGSYSEWAGTGMPVATGDAPGPWPVAQTRLERSAGAER